ncbi:MAG: hypothetical protein V3T23_02790 [Nitrososphaerales archaeon]
MNCDTTPEIVCLCGSSRFVGEIAVKAWELEKQGILVLGMHLLPSWYTEVGDHLAEHEGVAEILDELHLRKIDTADRVLVMNVNGYIGERTAIEIEYAQSLDKPVQWLVGWDLSRPNLSENGLDFECMMCGKITRYGDGSVCSECYDS